MMNISKDQDMILNISKEGAVTAKLHASVLFPDLFGHLTEDDRNIYFFGKQFKKWTKSRTVIRPSQSMANKNGILLHNHDISSVLTSVRREPTSSAVKRPKDKDGFVKVLSERRRKLSRMKDCFSVAIQKAVKKGQQVVLDELIERWGKLHDKRYLVTPFADSFWDMKGNLFHSLKSRFLKYGARDNTQVCYSLNEFILSGGKPVSENLLGRSLLRTSLCNLMS